MRPPLRRRDSLLLAEGLRTLGAAIVDLADGDGDWQVTLEGHTDNMPIATAQYPSNWELSAARAASVVHLFADHGVQPQRLAAMYGFHGDFIARRVQLTRPDPSVAFIAPPRGWWQRLRLAHRTWRGACGHLIWEFEAVKSGR